MCFGDVEDNMLMSKKYEIGIVSKRTKRTEREKDRLTQKGKKKK